MTMQELFFKFQGRIPRKIYIFAFLFLFCFQVGTAYLLLKMMGLTLETYMVKVSPQSLRFDFFSNLIFLWPTLAIGVKRLQDIGWSSSGYVMLYSAMMFVHLLGALGAFGTFVEGGDPSAGFKGIIGMFGLGTLAFFVIMVFFPGTKGENKYGYDPL